MDKKVGVLMALGLVFGIAKDLVKGAENDIKRDAAVKKAVNEYMEKEKAKAKLVGTFVDKLTK